MTQQQLDNLGRAIPTALKATADWHVFGHPDLGILYGFYEWGTESAWRKVLKGILNGTRR